jgi:hypothetical protein
VSGTEAKTDVRPGELVTLAVDTRRLHYFDLETSAALSLSASAAPA